MCITSMAFMRASWSYERASSLVVGAARATGATKANSKAAAARLLMLESFIRDMIVSLCEVGAQRSSRERYACYGDRVTVICARKRTRLPWPNGARSSPSVPSTSCQRVARRLSPSARLRRRHAGHGGVPSTVTDVVVLNAGSSPLTGINTVTASAAVRVDESASNRHQHRQG